MHEIIGRYGSHTRGKLTENKRIKRHFILKLKIGFRATDRNFHEYHFDARLGHWVFVVLRMENFFGYFMLRSVYFLVDLLGTESASEECWWK